MPQKIIFIIMESLNMKVTFKLQAPTVLDKNVEIIFKQPSRM